MDMDLATKVMLLRIFVGFSGAFLFIGLIVGFFKPKWVLFWQKQPHALTAMATVAALALLMFMTGWTGIAMLTLKPKDPQQRHEEQRRSREDQNMLQFDR